ncbi:hypothetical protein HSB1_42220 [Halogranum salarium B-1]|uniref:Uncharacterized protein n=1 Tax=Halogranum salarium B-1 TaxID=1210908 RepID=J3JDJ1_9EURY|nr:hypothetical protein HSB1_42220 [Halogranum salarium B-1]
MRESSAWDGTRRTKSVVSFVGSSSGQKSTSPLKTKRV